MDWGRLHAAVLCGDIDQLPRADLVEMIYRAVLPEQFHALAEVFARQGHSAFWMHTINRAMRVLCKAPKLLEFYQLHLQGLDAAVAHPDIAENVTAMRRLVLVQIAYKTPRPERQRLLDELGPQDRTADWLSHSLESLPSSHEERCCEAVC